MKKLREDTIKLGDIILTPSTSAGEQGDSR
jgi:hypothetical protein